MQKTGQNLLREIHCHISVTVFMVCVSSKIQGSEVKAPVSMRGTNLLVVVFTDLAKFMEYICFVQQNNIFLKQRFPQMEGFKIIIKDNHTCIEFHIFFISILTVVYCILNYKISDLKQQVEKGAHKFNSLQLKIATHIFLIQQVNRLKSSSNTKYLQRTSNHLSNLIKTFSIP